MVRFKQLLVILLGAALVLIVMPLSSIADTAGDLTITGGILNTDYSFDGGKLTILTGMPMTISGTSTNESIYIAADVTANITIEDLTLLRPDIQGQRVPGIEILDGGTLNLTVLGTNTLVGGKYMAGVSVRNTACLVVSAASTGVLNAIGNVGAAGIGGNADGNLNYSYTGGTIIINGGTINATAAHGSGQTIVGAGIGSGWCFKPTSAGHITINGGIVKAVCEGFAAGIGGGYNCSGSFFWINGGTVVATGYEGIGGGAGGGGGKLLVTGGTIKANSVQASVFYDEDYEKSAYLTVVELDALNDVKKIDSLTVSFGGTNYGYGIEDVYTDEEGSLYLYLPLEAVVSTAIIPGQLYAGSVTTTDDALTSQGILYPMAVITATAAPGGSISPEGETYVAYGDDQTFTITADSGFHIAAVEVDGSNVGALSSYTFSSVDQDHTITATFDLNPITSSAGSTIYVGDKTTLTPPVNNGAWDFDNEFISLENHSDGTATVTGLKVGTTVISYAFGDFEVSFPLTISERPVMVIIATAAAGGSISPAGETPVVYGDDQTFTITPDGGFHIVSVEVDGSNVGALSSYTFSSVDQDHTITATFDLNPIISSAGSTIYLKGRTTLTPPVINGDWGFDDEYISLERHSDGTVTITGLKEGTTSISYTFGDFEVSFPLRILGSNLPSTGQSNTLIKVLIALAALCAAGALIITRYAHKGKNEKA